MLVPRGTSWGDAVVEDSAPGALDGGKRRRVHFDPTINLGHMLTFLGMISALGGVYATVRGELSAHDVRISANEKAANVDQVRIRDDVQLIREDVREMRRGIDELRKDVRK